MRKILQIVLFGTLFSCNQKELISEKLYVHQFVSNELVYRHSLLLNIKDKDSVIDYTYLAKDTIKNTASSIFRHIRKGEILALANLHNIDAEVFEFEVLPGAKVTKNIIKELNFPRDAVFGGIIRDGKALISDGDFQVLSGDKVIVFCLPEAIHIVEDLFR